MAKNNYKFRARLCVCVCVCVCVFTQKSRTAKCLTHFSEKGYTKIHTLALDGAQTSYSFDLICY